MADSTQPQPLPELPQVFKSDDNKKKPILPNSLSRVRIMFGVIGFLVMAVGVGLAVNLAQQQQTTRSRASEVTQTPTPSSTSVAEDNSQVIQLILSSFGEAGSASEGDQNGDGIINELDFGPVYSR